MASRPRPFEIERNLVLIGGRGCGKTSIAKRILQRKRDFTLFSVDALIRYESGGRSIPEIVERDGWSGFRELEFQVVEKLSAFDRGALVDCGGGVVADLDAGGDEVFSRRKVDAIRRNGLVVYLRRHPEYLLERIGDDPNRPELSDKHSFVETMARRDPWYHDAADLVLECGLQRKSQLARQILKWFHRNQATLRR